MLFSGDAFNPSLESSVTKGAHMVPVLNGLMGEGGRGVACVGVSVHFTCKMFINCFSGIECSFSPLFFRTMHSYLDFLGEDLEIFLAERA